MDNSVTLKRITSLAVLLPALVSILVTRGINIDPVNIPKMTLLVIGAGYLFGLILSTKFKELRSDKLFSTVLITLIVGLISSSLLSITPFTETIFGSYGRNTGALTYLALIILLIATYLINSENLVDRFLFTLFAVGLFNVLYGMLQISGHDPIDWNNTFHAIIGTFGNPDFSSAFISISMITYPLIFQKITGVYKYLLIPAFLLSVFAIIKTSSQQGYLFLAVGYSVLAISYILRKIGKKSLGFAAIGAVVIGGMAAVLGFLQIGPLGKILYQPSISLRGFYWNAGFSMFKSSPIYGNGLDSYGELYLRNRSAASILPPGGMNVYSNASHNVFIDLAASGGLLLIVPYLIIIGYAFYLAFKVFKSSAYNLTFNTLVAIWAAFLIQSSISINQIGLAVWIWASTGALIAHSLLLLNRRTAMDSKKMAKAKNQETGAGAFLSAFAMVVLFSIAVLPEQIADMNFKSGMASRDIKVIEAEINKYPLSSERLSQTANVFLKNSLYDQALPISLKAVSFNPDHLNSWITLISNPKASFQQRQWAKKNLIRLDPRSSEWRNFVIK